MARILRVGAPGYLHHVTQRGVRSFPDLRRGSCVRKPEGIMKLGLSDERPIHVVCALKTDPEEVLLITVYEPSKRPEKWTEDYRRRKE